MAGMSIKIDALNLEPVKELIQFFGNIAQDERIPQDIRSEMDAKVKEILAKCEES